MSILKHMPCTVNDGEYKILCLLVIQLNRTLALYNFWNIFLSYSVSPHQGHTTVTVTLFRVRVIYNKHNCYLKGNQCDDSVACPNIYYI